VKAFKAGMTPGKTDSLMYIVKNTTAAKIQTAPIEFVGAALTIMRTGGETLIRVNAPGIRSIETNNCAGRRVASWTHCPVGSIIGLHSETNQSIIIVKYSSNRQTIEKVLSY
jgi:hypothetical protein